MPTAADYEQLATDFERLDGDAVDTRAAIAGRRSTPGVGGTFGDLVDLAIDEVTDRFDRADTSLDGAVAECRRRMAICDDYADEVDDYEQTLEEWSDAQARYDPFNPFSLPPGTRPQYPDPPYPWVDV